MLPLSLLFALQYSFGCFASEWCIRLLVPNTYANIMSTQVLHAAFLIFLLSFSCSIKSKNLQTILHHFAIQNIKNNYTTCISWATCHKQCALIKIIKVHVFHMVVKFWFKYPVGIRILLQPSKYPNYLNIGFSPNIFFGRY